MPAVWCGRLKVRFYAEDPSSEITEKPGLPYKRRRGIEKTLVLPVLKVFCFLAWRYLACLPIRKVRVENRFLD